MHDQAPGLEEYKQTEGKIKLNRKVIIKEIPEEKKTLRKSQSNDLSKSKTTRASFADALENSTPNLSTIRLPDKVLAMDKKLEVPNFDTMSKIKKIQEKLSKEGLNKRMYEDVDDFKDLREEKERRNMPSFIESRKLRENFIKKSAIKKPNIVSEFMKVFSMETK
jgi:hypothetical protein